jgi:ppGpp synthetase/RelA/SpoT-type nucleotidyltranferase
MNTVDRGAFDNEYRSRRDSYERLATEASFVLDVMTRDMGVKVHAIESRVKTPDSLFEKALMRATEDPFGQIDDIVGSRIVALFLSDLERLEQGVSERFEVHSIDRKATEGAASEFGYMSNHFVVSLGSKYSGARYAGLTEQRFEIQIRTVLMDAWAVVSHRLDYKGTSSIPKELQKDFFALAGLFYVADQHFELFVRSSAERTRSVEEKVASLDQLLPEPIDVDTLDLYMRLRFPGREHDRADVSEVLEEIATFFDFHTIGDVEAAVHEGLDAALAAEGGDAEQMQIFATVGILRISLDRFSDGFNAWRSARYDASESDEGASFEAWNESMTQ